MNFKNILALLSAFVIAGCGSNGPSAPAHPDPNALSTPQEQIQKVQSNPDTPDGLKKIQTETLQHQPGVKR